ncbi:hypothetical protein BE08_42215 [Sorangium cellulosum]|uniref:Uncharacterized protein n=1 Tax=Sorangium cellulosum TaxID=56 RepID=A0A150P4C5_SORCE|nr:hypothetical protein BE08_42215 [Sorangium cellulosum]
MYRLGDAEPDVMLDLVDAAGRALTVGLAVPGFGQDAVAVGERLDIDFSSSVASDWMDKIAHLRLERDGELVVAVGESHPVGLTFRSGERACSTEDVACRYDELPMVVAAEGSPAVSIANGESAEVGALTVTNDRFIEVYDISGACDFGLSFEYLVGIAPTAR